MRIVYPTVILVVIGAILIGLISFPVKNYEQLPSNEGTGESEESVVSIYNRSVTDITVKSQSFQHKSIVIDRFTNEDTIAKVLSDVKKDKPVLITLEIPGSPGKNCLEEISEGLYNKKIETLCHFAGEYTQRVYLRLNPSIEVPVHIYPWQYQSPITFINAFRHVAILSRKAEKNVKLVWATDGYPGVEEYWPGSDVVDFISITINSKSELMSTAYPRTNDPVTLIKRKIHRMRFMNKPILFLNGDKGKKNAIIGKEIMLAVDEIKKDTATVYQTAIFTGNKESSNRKVIDRPKIGVYDPKQLLLTLASVGIEHLFVDVKDIRNGYFTKEFKAIMSRHHDAIVTVEPLKGQDSLVLVKTIAGVYDEEFTELYRLIAKAPQTVYLRFAHEMEIPIHRYPWQSQDPVLYIKAFRYFMNFKGAQAKNIKKVWGPAGDRGSMEWWPGSDVVDYISIAIYGLPDKNITDPTQQESFSTIYNRKSYRMRFADKPIFITEFGVKGDEAFQLKWLKEAAYCVNKHPEVAGVCYFNLTDNPKVWGNIPAPDWSVSRNTFSTFTHILADKQ